MLVKEATSHKPISHCQQSLSNTLQLTRMRIQTLSFTGLCLKISLVTNSHICSEFNVLTDLIIVITSTSSLYIALFQLIANCFIYLANFENKWFVTYWRIYKTKGHHTIEKEHIAIFKGNDIVKHWGSVSSNINVFNHAHILLSYNS